MINPLNQQLADAVKRSGLAQRAVADAMGVTQPQLNHWLTGRRSIPIARAEQLAHACGCVLHIKVVQIS